MPMDTPAGGHRRHLLRRVGGTPVPLRRALDRPPVGRGVVGCDLRRRPVGEPVHVTDQRPERRLWRCRFVCFLLDGPQKGRRRAIACRLLPRVPARGVELRSRCGRPGLPWGKGFRTVHCGGLVFVVVLSGGFTTPSIPPAICHYCRTCLTGPRGVVMRSPARCRGTGRSRWGCVRRAVCVRTLPGSSSPERSTRSGSRRR